MRPDQVIDERSAWRSRLANSMVLEVLMSHVAIQLNGNGRHHIPGQTLQDVNESQGREAIAVVEALVHNQDVAENFFCSADMVPLVMYGGSVLDSTDRFRIDMLPAEAGWAIFDAPLVIGDIRGVGINVNLIVWHKMVTYNGADPEHSGKMYPGVVFHMFGDTDRFPDPTSEKLKTTANTKVLREYRDAMGKWAYAGFMYLSDEQRVGPPTLTPSEVQAELILKDGDQPTDATNISRILLSFFRLLGQTIVKVTDEEPDRHTSRRARRMGIPHRVSVIRLRRNLYKSEPGESEIEWQHRWVVRGHWAWRVCGAGHPLAEPDGKGGFHARVWINPYIKGPDGKPLVITDKVNALVQ